MRGYQRDISYEGGGVAIDPKREGRERERGVRINAPGGGKKGETAPIAEEGGPLMEGEKEVSLTRLAGR